MKWNNEWRNKWRIESAEAAYFIWYSHHVLDNVTFSVPVVITSKKQHKKTNSELEQVQLADRHKSIAHQNYGSLKRHILMKLLC